MDIDDLRSAWRMLDERVAAAQGTSAEVLRELKRNETRSAVRPIAWLLWAEVGGAVLATVLLGAFLGQHWRTPSFAVPALALHVTAVLVIAGAAAQLKVLSGVDYSGPVVGLQRTLTELAARRLRQVRWQLLLVFPLWTPAAIVAMKGVFDVDVYRWFGMGWVMANLAFGAAMAPIMVWVVRRLRAGVPDYGILKELADDIAGRRVATALRLVDEIAAFETDREAA